MVSIPKSKKSILFTLFTCTGYVKELMSELLLVYASGKATPPNITTPDFLCSMLERPDKMKAIHEKQTRFQQQF